MKRSSQQGGFTIIESVLFLAVSAFIFIIGFMGVGSRVDAVQFTDSIRSLDAYIKRTMQETNTGLNLSSDAFECDWSGGLQIDIGGATSDNQRGRRGACVINGVEFYFSNASAPTSNPPNSHIAEHAMASLNTDINNFSDTGFLALKTSLDDAGISMEEFLETEDYVATVDSAATQYDYEWGVVTEEIYVGTGPSATPMNDIRLRFFRSVTGTDTFILSNYSGSWESLTEEATVCLRGRNNQTAALIFTPDKTTRVDFDNERCL